MRRVSGVLALVVILSVAAAAVGGQQTAAQTVPTVALKSATLKSKWKESWLTGSVRFSGTVSGPATSASRCARRKAAGWPPQ